MAFQRPPPSPLPDDDSSCTPPLLPSPASSEPSLSSASTSASSLATPFEQLAFDDALPRPPSPQSPPSAKPHADSPHDAPAPTDVIRDGHDLSGAMFERMQDSDRTQSRRSTPASECPVRLRVPEQMVWTHVGGRLPRHAAIQHAREDLQNGRRRSRRHPLPDPVPRTSRNKMCLTPKAPSEIAFCRCRRGAVVEKIQDGCETRWLRP